MAYESQKIDRTSWTDLLQLVSALGAQQKGPTQMESNIFKQFTQDADSFNNEELQTNLNKINAYYSENVSGMGSDEIDAYEMLKDKYKTQMDKNTQFDLDIQQSYGYGQEIMKIADKYRNAEDARNFSWKTSIIGDDGQMRVQDNIVSLPNPEDYEGGVENKEFRRANNEAVAALGGIEGYNQKRDEYKIHLKNEIQRQIGSYSDYQDKMIKNYGGAGGRLSSNHKLNFAELDEAYGFVVSSMSDDGLFDDEERNVYMSSIMQKSYNPIKNFMIKDNELKTGNRQQLRTDMDALTELGDMYSKHFTAIAKASLSMDESNLKNEAITIPKNTTYNPDTEDKSYTYEDLQNLDNHPELANYVADIQNNLNDVQNKLKNKNSAYMKNDGGSYIDEMEEKPWTTGLQDKKTGYQPTIYGDVGGDGEDLSLDDKNVEDDLKESNIEKIDSSTVVSNIDPKYQKDGQYPSGGKKLEEEINTLNETVDNLSNNPIKGNSTKLGSTVFTTGNSIENFFNWPKGSGGLGYGAGFKKAIGERFGPYSAKIIPGLSDITGKNHEDGNFTPSDYLKIETQYKNDIESKDKLVTKYRSLRNAGVDKNSPELIELQNQINDIYQRWFARQEIKPGPLGIGLLTGDIRIRDWNLALEDSGKYKEGATSLYKFMNFLKLRYEEEKQKVIKQKDKVQNIKNNLS